MTAFGFAALAWHHEHGAMTGFLTDHPQESPTRYIWVNDKLTINQYGIDGLLGHTQAFNGSLWTLIYEFKYYLLLGTLVLAAFSWYVVEQPFLQLKNVDPRRRRRRSAPGPGARTVVPTELAGAAVQA